MSLSNLSCICIIKCTCSQLDRRSRTECRLSESGSSIDAAPASPGSLDSDLIDLRTDAKEGTEFLSMMHPPFQSSVVSRARSVAPSFGWSSSLCMQQEKLASSSLRATVYAIRRISPITNLSQDAEDLTSCWDVAQDSASSL